MARVKRYHFPGSFYHVMARGVNAHNIFFSEWDRYRLLFLMQEGVERYGHQIHAFCFMNNHIHLLIQVGEISLSKIMQNLTSRYAQFVNARYSRVGHLFQGRFKAILIEEGFYFKKLLRYIHMNPVRANIISDPGDHIWSSHSAYMNRKKIGWLVTGFGLSHFGKKRDESVRNYSAYVATQESAEELKELRGSFKDGQFLGSNDFLDSIKKSELAQINIKLPLKVLLNAVCETLEIQEEYVISSSQSAKASFARGLFSWMASRIQDTVIKEIASLINRDASTVSGLISRFYDRNKDLSTVHELEKKIREKTDHLTVLQL